MNFSRIDQSPHPNRSHGLSHPLGKGTTPFNRQRRQLLLAGASALIAASCARQSDPGAPSTRSQPINAAAADTPTRSVQHAHGETTIPANPQRVAVLEIGAMEAIMALGVEPVAAPQFFLENLQHLPPVEREVINIGVPNSPNFETLVRAQPDLILTSKVVTNDENYKLLSRIAPTIALDVENFTDWKTTTQLCGEVFGKEAQAQQLAKDYDNKLEALKSSEGKALKELNASVVFLFRGRIAAMGEDSFSGKILTDLGISRPGQQGAAANMLISLETLTDIDGDVMFLLQPQGKTELAEEISESIAKTQSHPLWSQLNAVKSDQVYEVDTHWYGAGYLAANRILDDLIQYLN